MPLQPLLDESEECHLIINSEDCDRISDSELLLVLGGHNGEAPDFYDHLFQPPEWDRNFCYITPELSQQVVGHHHGIQGEPTANPDQHPAEPEESVEQWVNRHLATASYGDHRFLYTVAETSHKYRMGHHMHPAEPQPHQPPGTGHLGDLEGGPSQHSQPFSDVNIISSNCLLVTRNVPTRCLSPWPYTVHTASRYHSMMHDSDDPLTPPKYFKHPTVSIPSLPAHWAVPPQVISTPPTHAVPPHAVPPHAIPTPPAHVITVPPTHNVPVPPAMGVMLLPATLAVLLLSFPIVQLCGLRVEHILVMANICLQTALAEHDNSDLTNWVNVSISGQDELAKMGSTPRNLRTNIKDIMWASVLWAYHLNVALVMQSRLEVQVLVRALVANNIFLYGMIEVEGQMVNVAFSHSAIRFTVHQLLFCNAKYEHFVHNRKIQPLVPVVTTLYHLALEEMDSSSFVAHNFMVDARQGYYAFLETLFNDMPESHHNTLINSIYGGH
ncbi:hypothetical protein DFH29DRAFT_879303 [Suillus ampliporus]|nr:hypothetical protein DFH29DRAFT_879303 [Suillus ampliporus]